MTYFERPAPIAIIFGSFFALFLPLLLLSLVPNFVPWLPYLALFEAVGLGTSHFIITLALYLDARNLAHFASSTRNRIIYFGVPLAIFAFFTWSGLTEFRARSPLQASYVFAGLRFFDFFHVGRQSVGMLQILKRPIAAALPSWSRRAENVFFVGMAALQWQTYLLGGFDTSRWLVLVPAVAAGALFVLIALAHVRVAARDAARAHWLGPCYFAMQALCAASAVYQTRLYLIALTLHYVEYHVIMLPRCVRAPQQPAAVADRLFGALRRHALSFYALLAAATIAFELRHSLRVALPSTAAFVFMFDGVFLVHYFVEAFVWKFGQPYYRETLSALYFVEPAPAPAAPHSLGARRGGVAAVAVVGGVVTCIAAVPALRSALERHMIEPMRAENHLRWGVELARRGELLEAQRHLQAALDRAPRDAKALSAMQWVRAHLQGEEVEP